MNRNYTVFDKKKSQNLTINYNKPDYFSWHFFPKSVQTKPKLVKKKKIKWKGWHIINFNKTLLSRDWANTPIFSAHADVFQRILSEHQNIFEKIFFSGTSEEK